MSQIGKGLGEGGLISSDCKKFITHHKAAGKPLTNQEPGRFLYLKTQTTCSFLPVSKCRRLKSSFFVTVGVVQIGKELGDDGPISEDHRRATTRHKAAGNPPKNQELGRSLSLCLWDVFDFHGRSSSFIICETLILTGFLPALLFFLFFPQMNS